MPLRAGDPEVREPAGDDGGRRGRRGHRPGERWTGGHLGSADGVDDGARVRLLPAAQFGADRGDGAGPLSARASAFSLHAFSFFLGQALGPMVYGIALPLAGATISVAEPEPSLARSAADACDACARPSPRCWWRAGSHPGRRRSGDALRRRRLPGQHIAKAAGVSPATVSRTSSAPA